MKRNNRFILLMTVGVLFKQSDLCRCFETFKLIHTIVDDEEAISMVTTTCVEMFLLSVGLHGTLAFSAIVQAARDVVADFAKDNVKYLELRTTPRANAQTGQWHSRVKRSMLGGLGCLRLE